MEIYGNTLVKPTRFSKPRRFLIYRMKKFKQIVCVDNTRLTNWALAKLSDYSEMPVRIFNDYPAENQEIIERIAEADCLLVSWKTPINAEAIQQAKSLNYIGMCCSLIDKKSANVAVEFAENQGIVVKGVRDYGDEGVVEFIIAQLISLAKGLGKYQWKPMQTELKGKVLGIIGMGTVGQMLASVALAFGMKVLYFSRTRKPAIENENLVFVSLEKLLQESDVVSTHLPRNNRIIGKNEFELMKPNSVFLNTSVGPTFEVDALKNWLDKAGNFAIFDHDGAFGIEDIEEFSNTIYSPKTSGMTDAAFDRLSEKVLKNIENYLESR